jgi:2-iminobutanoate/2-iminopropanoate deaminase
VLKHPPAQASLHDFPYSNVVVSGELVVIASQVPFDDQDHLVSSAFDEQAHQVFANLGRSLHAAGCGFDDVIKVTGYLANPDLVLAYNEVYRQYFTPPYPARSTVACSLVVPGMLLQVDALAVLPTARSSS